MLDGVLGDHAGVDGGAAAHDDDLVDVAQLLVGDPHLVELEPAVLGVAAQQRVGDRARLLEDLLAHEPVVAVLLRGREVPVDVVAPALGRVAVEVGDLDAVAGDRDHLVLAELQRLAGVLDEGRDVGAEEVLALAEAHHQRRVASGGDHPGRVVRVDRDQGEGALEPPADPLHRGGQVGAAGHLALQQLRGDLGVGLGAQFAAVGLRARPEPGEVLDDPVVHQRDPAVRAQVRVRVGVVGGAVGGPAGVPDAGRGRAAADSRRSPSRGWRACRPACPRTMRHRRRPGRCRPSRSRGTPAAAARR